MDGYKSKRKSYLPVKEKAKVLLWPWMHFLLLFFLLALFLYSHTVKADAVNNEWLSTTRALSMGNVGIASAEDAPTAMFYNPAALAKIKKGTVELVGPQIEMGMGNLMVAKTSVDYGKQIKLANTVPLLKERKNTVSSLGFSIYPNFTAQNFAFGILARGEGASYMKGGDLLEFRSKYYIIPTLGISIGALSGRFKLGFGFRLIQATENSQSTFDTSNVGYQLNAREGMGMGLDAGALLTIPWAALPTFGFVARNLGDTTFTGSAYYKVATNPVPHEKIKMTYDGGFSLSPAIGKRSVLNFAVDYRDMQNVHKVDLYRRINGGIELGFNRVMFLRGGYGRGYWTAGIGFNAKSGSLDLGTYSEEMSDTKINGQYDRRISMRLGKRF